MISSIKTGKYTSRAGVGTSSILLIIVMLCLTVFSVLALMSAKVDKNMTDNTVASVSAYYAADTEAQRMLMLLDEALANGELPNGISEQDGILSFTVAASETSELQVTARRAQYGYKLISYRLVPAGEWDSGAWDSDEWDDLWK